MVFDGEPSTDMLPPVNVSVTLTLTFEPLCLRVVRPSVRPSCVVRLSVNIYSTWRDTYLYLVERFQQNLAQIFIAWVGIAEKFFSVEGQGRSMALHHHTWHRHSHVSPTCRIDAGLGPPPLKFWTAWPRSWLDVLTCRRSTVGGRAFPVAGTKVWNGLPSDVTSSSSMAVFKNWLK